MALQIGLRRNLGISRARTPSAALSKTHSRGILAALPFVATIGLRQRPDFPFANPFCQRKSIDRVELPTRHAVRGYRFSKPWPLTARTGSAACWFYSSSPPLSAFLRWSNLGEAVRLLVRSTLGGRFAFGSVKAFASKAVDCSFLARETCSTPAAWGEAFVCSCSHADRVPGPQSVRAISASLERATAAVSFERQKV